MGNAPLQDFAYRTPISLVVICAGWRIFILIAGWLSASSD